MAIDEKMVRELKKRFELEMNKKEVEIIEHWRLELEEIYKKRYESLSSLQLDIKRTIEHMDNRITLLKRIIRESM